MVSRGSPRCCRATLALIWYSRQCKTPRRRVSAMGRGRSWIRSVRTSGCHSVRTINKPILLSSADGAFSRYLQNGNILAAKTFIKHFVKGLPSSLTSGATSVQVGGEGDEVLMTSDSMVNFSQLAVATCQRANGDKSKVPRECWVRLCGTYQSKGGPLALPDIRRVRSL